MTFFKACGNIIVAKEKSPISPTTVACDGESKQGDSSGRDIRIPYTPLTDECETSVDVK